MNTLDPEARDMIIRTIIGEAGNQNPLGWTAVAHVIKNRADSGRWGKDRSISAVLDAPSQFAARDPRNPAYKLVTGADPKSPLYGRVGAVVDGVFTGSTPDPTKGANSYYSGAPPAWASNGPSTRIGAHTFVTNPDYAPVSPVVAQQTPPAAQPGGMSAPGVDPKVMAILNAAAGAYPGYKLKLTSGFRAFTPANPQSLHGKGEAADIQLVDEQGRPLGNYQDPKNFRVYEQFAQKAREIQQRDYPELNDRFRWGGYFWNGGPGHYGNMDLMHFDIGGPNMAGGSWAGGASPAMRAAYAGLVSEGMAGQGAGNGVTPRPLPMQGPDLAAAKAGPGGVVAPAPASAAAPLSPAPNPFAQAFDVFKAGMSAPRQDDTPTYPNGPRIDPFAGPSPTLQRARQLAANPLPLLPTPVGSTAQQPWFNNLFQGA